MKQTKARRNRWLLLIGFAFTVMADPVSSVAYAVEAALAALHNDMRSLVPTMALVLVVIAIVASSYSQLIRRFPNGGGSAEAMATAFGHGWAFLPMGALIVDFALTIAVSCAAGASAIIALVGGLAPARVPVAIVLAAAVAVGCSVGRRGRIGFALATLAFIGCSVWVLLLGIGKPAVAAAPPLAGDLRIAAVLLAMPLGMALATGVEAPANAIAQLAGPDRERRRIGIWTIWLMLAVVSVLTISLAALSVRLVGIEVPDDSTLIAETARGATGGGIAFAAFQTASAVLLLAAAASSFLAGSGLLKALAAGIDHSNGLLPSFLGRLNRFRTPHWGLIVFLLIAILLVAASGGQEQRLVRFYAVAVFASFLGALTAMATISFRDRAWKWFAVNLSGVAAVSFVFAVNLARTDAVIALVMSLLISLLLWVRWVRTGRPAGVVAAPRAAGY